MHRRDFLKGCASFAALAAVRGFGITNLLFDSQLSKARADSFAPQQPPPNNRDLIVLVFVRGGIDGLNVLVPFNTSPTDHHRYYNILRPTLHIPAPNSSEPRKAVDLDGRFALHPDAARGTPYVPSAHASDTGGLYELYRRGDLAIVVAAGSPDVTGSHFDSELYMDLGGKHNQGGWLARYLDAIGEPLDALAIAPQWGIPPSLLSTSGRAALSIPNAREFGPQWYTNTWTHDNNRRAILQRQRALLAAMYQRGNAYVESVGRTALATYDMLANVLNTNYTPQAHYLTDPTYVADGGVFGNALQTVARIAKANLANPLRVATIDVGGGYDTHDNQGTVDWNGNSRFPRLITNLANNLKAFCDDMEADPQWRGRFVVIVLSEFGRVLYQNDSAGTDHGAGNIMLVVGSGARYGARNINAGIYGEWPGLSHFGFNDGLVMTTDYRRVIADVLIARTGLSRDLINQLIFPGLNYVSGFGIAVPR
ncbi:MAG: DUF1501 domain-containing protein [Thermoflexales bacterium]|nr:DUF1501 domain-containing protein [Thermoflexales bacterium]MCS7323931.1 DUF1501 domain-containing protein [Thermoflexales bacterium]MDW8054409.1 DUF1501 domain-containing protein [Anaerolineae bacterium]MDW8292785.1 DUF1501 domain-containing protein [Anaerolineae bacterium]